ncbi:MAG: PIN domain-containing protein [Propionibacteriaceae bacterium]|nr:PIN domain-containing protein [Propionibacteriaceae bacterium]
MTNAFDDSLIDGWQPLEGTFGLPDLDDEHVLATAVTADASVIVTTNLVHFPDRALPVGIQAVSPADFTARIARTHPGPAIAALVQNVDPTGQTTNDAERPARLFRQPLPHEPDHYAASPLAIPIAVMLDEKFVGVFHGHHGDGQCENP